MHACVRACVRACVCVCVVWQDLLVTPSPLLRPYMELWTRKPQEETSIMVIATEMAMTLSEVLPTYSGPPDSRFNKPVNARLHGTGEYSVAVEHSKVFCSGRRKKMVEDEYIPCAVFKAEYLLGIRIVIKLFSWGGGGVGGEFEYRVS